MPRSSIDNSGSMPFETYLQKLEQTPMFEDPEDVHTMHRSLLRDFRPDAPFLADEAPLENNFSEQRLNFQYGDGWSDVKPDLPDGTFLDYEFLQADPRGHTTDINYGGYLAERGTRYSLIPKTSDDSPTVHEGPIGAPLYADMRDEANDRFRQQYKNFDTARDGWTGGRLMHKPKEHTLSKITPETDPYLVDEGVNYNQSSILQKLEHANVIGYNTTTSQDYKIGSFSQVRGSRSLADDDWSKNRRNTYHDQEIRVKFKDAVVPKSVALSMIDLSQHKYNQTQALRNYNYQNSTVNPLTKRHALIANTLNGRDQTRATLPRGPMQESEFVTRNGGDLVPRVDSNRMLKHQISNYTAKAMVAATRKKGATEAGDIRDMIAQSIVNPKAATATNRAIGRLDATQDRWLGADARPRQQDEHQIANFKMIKPKIFSAADQAMNLHFDDPRATSYSLDQRALVNKNSLDLYESALTDGIDFTSSQGVQNASVASHGSKFMMNFMDKDRPEDELFDV